MQTINTLANRPKTFNFYCDESCHLENDKLPFMLIGYTSCAYNQVKLHSENIRKIKRKYFLKGEVKWSALSKSQYPLYCDLIDYFFAAEMQFRAIVIDKSQLNHEAHNQSHDEFYFKMYYQVLNKKIFPEHNYNIYLDIKDTRSHKKAKGLKDYLNRNYLSVRTLQNIKSHESELMQLTDIIIGAISYHLRGENKVIAKTNLINRIQANSGSSFAQSTSPGSSKFNLFFIDLK